MEVRKGKQSDAAQAQKLSYSTMQLFGLVPDPNGIDIELGHFGEQFDEFLLQLVACESDKIIGCISLLRFDACEGKLSGFYVDPTYQGRGIGQRLLKSTLDHAKSIGLTGIYLETWDKMEAAANLYKKFGWKRVNDPPRDSGAQRAYYLRFTADNKQSHLMQKDAQRL
jgi:GNAT superfamily N-acetyltransferase